MARAAMAAAATATTRRAVRGTSFMTINPVWYGTRCYGLPLRLRFRVRGWGQTGAVTGRAELIRRAAGARRGGVLLDWRGREVDVSDETLAAVLDVLGTAGPRGSRRRPGRGATAPFPRRGGRGASRCSCTRCAPAAPGGTATCATWPTSPPGAARALGADFVLVNPLHAAEPAAPVSPSPYLAMTRRHLSPLYLRIEDIPEYAGLGPEDRARVDALGAPLRAASRTAALIDRDAVWTAKRAALEIIRAAGLESRPAGRVRRLPGRGPRRRWRTGPPGARSRRCTARTGGPGRPALADPRSAEVAALRRERAGRVEFHAWLQWLTTRAGRRGAAGGPARPA